MEDTLELLKPLCAKTGRIGVKHVYSALGKAARIGYIVPDSMPYVSSLWAGYRAGRRDAEADKKGTSMHYIPALRFSSAALCFCTLLSEALSQQDFGALALTGTMGYNKDKLKTANLPTISFDASPWGGGGILWINGAPAKLTHCIWGKTSLKVLKAFKGSADYQTSFEYLTLFIVAVTFDEILSTTGALIRGDNIGALNDALTLKPTAPGMNSIARELGWRRIVSRWQYKLSHLPPESNAEADALSRLRAVPRSDFPEEVLGSVEFIKPLAQDDRLASSTLRVI